MSAGRACAVTGYGCVSALGWSLVQNTHALREGTPAIRPVSLFPTGNFRSRTAGQVPEGFTEIAIRIDRRAANWPRASQLILVALEEALRGRQDFQADLVIAGTTSGGMDAGEQFYRGIHGTISAPESRRLARDYTPQQTLRHALQDRGGPAPIRIVSNACASGTNALGLGAAAIRAGHAERVMVVTYDALSELVFAGFDALQASTPDVCKPFDNNRTGLALGEGAAVFLLESGDRADSPCGWIAGYGTAQDNFHLTKPDPSGEGPRQAMCRAIEDAGWAPESIDYVNAHGTGTLFNDECEARALLAVCPAAPVSSTKGLTGHALGAAGGLEAAFCLMAMSGSFLPPNAPTDSPMEGLNLVSAPCRAKLTRVLSNSFGFGGANATLALEAAT